MVSISKSNVTQNNLTTDRLVRLAGVNVETIRNSQRIELIFQISEFLLTTSNPFICLKATILPLKSSF